MELLKSWVLAILDWLNNDLCMADLEFVEISDGQNALVYCYCARMVDLSTEYTGCGVWPIKNDIVDARKRAAAEAVSRHRERGLNLDQELSKWLEGYIIY